MARKLYLLALLWALAVPVAFAVDVPLADYCRRHQHDSGWKKHFAKLCSVSEVYAHGFGVAAILATAFVLDPAQRRRLPRMIACTVCGGVSANVLKFAVVRWRPRERAVECVWDSFGGWFGGVDWGPLDRVARDHAYSFPSGHAATAVSLAIVLTALYPRGRWLFALFAVLAAAQRLDTTAHYLSDTLAGAAIACAICGLIFDRRFAGRWFDRLEKL
jgi:membrane-associated phospholipid phosphatase